LDVVASRFSLCNFDFFIVNLFGFFFTSRKDFRPAYTKLNLLGSFMPNTPILALTATATACYQREIKRSLGMQNVVAVEAYKTGRTSSTKFC